MPASSFSCNLAPVCKESGKKDAGDREEEERSMMMKMMKIITSHSPTAMRMRAGEDDAASGKEMPQQQVLRL